MVATRLIGTVTVSEYRSLYRYVKTMPDYETDFPEISDFRPVTHFEFSHQQLVDLAHRVAATYTGHRLKTAILASSSLSYGMARTYQTVAGLSDIEEVEIFETADRAFAWLGHDAVPQGFESFGMN